MKFPPHKASLTLTHNPHKDMYQTVAEYIAENTTTDGCVDSIYVWVSDGERANAIATDELWLIQVYPRTPVGFYGLAASTFEAVLIASGGEA